MASVFKREKDKKIKGSKWCASWYDSEAEVWRTQVAYTDRALSQSFAQRLENESAAKREGFVSSFPEESIRPIEDQLAEYMTHLKRLKRSINYRDQLEAAHPAAVGGYEG